MKLHLPATLGGSNNCFNVSSERRRLVKLVFPFGGAGICIPHKDIKYHQLVAGAFFSSAFYGKLSALDLARHIIVNCLEFTFHKATKKIECSIKKCFWEVYQKIIEDLPLDVRVNLKACVERGLKDLKVINEDGTINKTGLEYEVLIGNRCINIDRIYWSPHDSSFFDKFINKLFGPENFMIDFPYIDVVDFNRINKNGEQIFSTLLSQGFVRKVVCLNIGQKFGNYIVVRRKIEGSVENFCKQFNAEFLIVSQKEQVYYILSRIIGN